MSLSQTAKTLCSIVVCISSTLSVSSAALAQDTRTSPDMGVSSAWDGAPVSSSKNSDHRQMAMLTPHLVRAGVNIKPVQRKTSTTSSGNASSFLGGSGKQSEQLPKQLDEALDVVTVTAQKMAKSGAAQAMEFMKVLNALVHQMDEPPVASPAGTPYIRNGASGHSQLVVSYSDEGRLRTTVQR